MFVRGNIYVIGNYQQMPVYCESALKDTETYFNFLMVNCDALCIVDSSES